MEKLVMWIGMDSGAVWTGLKELEGKKGVQF